MGYAGLMLGERNVIAERLKLSQGALPDALAQTFVELGRIEIAIAVVTQKQVIRGDQQRVPDRDGRLARSKSHNQTTVLGCGITAPLTRRGSRGFDQRPPQELTTLSGFALLAFAGALIVARAHARPGCQMARCWEACHVGTDLCQEYLSGRAAHARDGVQAVQLVLKRLQPLGDFGV